jgi:glycosyltransferase involved in cell wall biosynthesis
MRIAIVAYPYVPVPPLKYGGTEQVVFHLINGLKELGHEVILLAPGDSTIDCKIIPICEKSLGFAPTVKDKPKHDRLVKKAFQKTKQILNEIKDQVDIIHAHDFDLIDFQDKPNLTTLHGPISIIKLDYFLARKNLYYASISKNQQGTFPDLQYVGVVYNGLNPDAFKFVEEPDDYLCFLGRFDDQKNPHLAIQLALSLNMKIKIAGKLDFDGEGYFEKEIKPHLDNPLVEFLGEIDFKAKVKLLSKAKCNLHPTGFREPFGLNVLEAAYCGTPTLAINRGSMPELIEDGRTGVLVEDFVEGYHRIQECFEMDRNYISNRARLLFNYKTMAKQTVIAYEKVLEIYQARKDRDETILKLIRDTQDKLQSAWGN